jgi:hypothetical protein
MRRRVRHPLPVVQLVDRRDARLATFENVRHIQEAAKKRKGEEGGGEPPVANKFTCHFSRFA